MVLHKQLFMNLKNKFCHQQMNELCQNKIPRCVSIDKYSEDGKVRKPEESYDFFPFENKKT